LISTRFTGIPQSFFVLSAGFSIDYNIKKERFNYPNPFETRAFSNQDRQLFHLLIRKRVKIFKMVWLFDSIEYF
jgi:hypothetical protein